MSDNIIVGVVLYNPDVDRLRENLSAISVQVNEILVFDNGSNNLSDIKFLLRDFPKVALFSYRKNTGIAFALNTIIKKAQNKGYEWVVTLDQDSVAPSNLVSKYLKYLDEMDVGMLCCKIIDRNFGERSSDAMRMDGVEEVNLCITSASAINVEAWEKVGGFCEEMFIDGVDFDICMKLKEFGYKILRINDVKLLHEVGHSRIVSLFGKEELVFNHNPIRCYYMIRNSFLLGKRHHQLLRQIGLAIKRILLINIYEDNRCRKNRMMLKGICHAIIGKYGKYSD